MFRKFGGVALAASMLVSSTAFAAADANQGALPQGKAASVQQAQMFDDNGLLWLGGVGLVGFGIALVMTGNGHGTVGSTTTCPIGGCPPPVTPPPTTTTTTTTTTATTTTS